MRSNTTMNPLVSLKSEQIELADRNEDIRGRKVVDREGQDVGKVDDVFVDPIERRARFIAVKSGDFLGLGGKKFLIPIDAIQSQNADQVVINETRERILGGPQVEDEFGEPSRGDDVSPTGDIARARDTAGSPAAGGTAGTAGTGGADDEAPAVVVAVYEWYDVRQPYWSPDYQRRNWA